LVRRDLADCRALHQRVMTAFPDLGGEEARARLGALYRPEVDARTGVVTLVVQSRVQPDWGRLPGGGYLLAGGEVENPACKTIDRHYAGLSEGATLAFRLRANPTKKIETKSGPGGERRNGRRVELWREDEQLAWLERKGRDGGFAVLAAQVRVDRAFGAKQVGRVGDGGTGREARLTFGAVVYDGVLRVTDAEVFRETLEHGIGSAKAYGFGLLSVAPVRG
jgi:CRISPR system Cascade subunit CasE